LTSCLTSLEKSVLQIKTKYVSCHRADSKPVKQEVNSTVIRPPLVFRDPINTVMLPVSYSQNVLGTLLKGHFKVCVPYPRRFLLNVLILKAPSSQRI